MKKTLIIAEAGVNHNGEIGLAKELICAAEEAGVDFIKFQTFVPELLTSSSAKMADYQKKNTGKNDTQLNMLKKLVLSQEQHFELIDYCNNHRIQFCSSAFDLDSVEFLKGLNLPFWKIPSGEITNFPYLRKIAQYNEKIIMSTGMSTLSEIEHAIDVLTSYGTDRNKIIIMHCNTEYPTQPADVNLNVLKTLKQAFALQVGYSDHTLGIEFPIAAVALGAEVIEKHITIDNTLSGPDHKASLNPDELKIMVNAIRNIEKGMGSQIKKCTEAEKRNALVARKSITAICDIKKGDVFSENNITTKRPGTGLSPMLWAKVLGRVANRDFTKDEMINL